MSDRVKCPICGETDPMPESFCLYRMRRAKRARREAAQSRQCSFSVEGQERTERMLDELEAPAPGSIAAPALPA